MTPTDTTRVVALVVLGAIVISAITGLTVTACVTDRDLTRPEVLTFTLSAIIAVLGGLSFVRSGRWSVKPRNGDDDA